MGHGGAFAWDHPARIFAEYAALSGIAGAQGSDFDISDHAAITERDYNALAPFTWPANPRQRGGRFFGTGRFHTPDGRARMIPLTAPAAAKTDPAHPFRLNTGRIRDQWHTMTRTARSPRLSQHLAEPFLELHPQDAAALHLAPADLVQVTNRYGQAILRVLITDRVAPGNPFAPMHWTGDTAPSARIDALVPANPDPHSGQPDLKAAPVALARFPARWYGFAVSTTPFTPDSPYWSRTRTTGGWRAELAGTDAPADWIATARALFALPGAQVASVTDPARGLTRVAFRAGDRLLAALFVGPGPVALARDQVASRLGQPGAALTLAGQAGAGQRDPGPTVCACLNVGLNTIRDAIETGRALTVPALGAALGAGTSCGSCRPELGALIARFAVKEAAE
jgi:assimilatory nitrate reductase catalytic subunit